MRRQSILVSAMVVVVATANAYTAPSYEIIGLGTPLGGSYSTAYAINNNGQIVGMDRTPAGIGHAFLYEDGAMTDLGTLDLGPFPNSTIAYAINDNGQIVGSNTSERGLDVFIYEDGEMRAFARGASVKAINNAGTIVGGSGGKAVVIEEGNLVDLCIGAGSTGSTAGAEAINNSGLITGTVNFGSTHQGFLYDNGNVTYFGSSLGQYTYPYAINDSGQIIGSCNGATFLYENGVMIDLGLQVGLYGPGTDINNRGQIVGSGLNGAYLYEDGIVTDLGLLPGYSHSVALAINDNGWIVGYAHDASGTGSYEAVLWKPIPATPIHNITQDKYYETVQDAIDDANERDTIEVPVGTYTDEGNRDVDFFGKAITVRSEDPNDLNVVATTIIDCNGTAADPHRGFYFHSGETANSILDGFTVINGYGPNEPFGESEYSAGGAIYCIRSSPTIRNCVFAGNYCHYWGGAVHCDNSSATFSNCTFKENMSFDTGGGLYNRMSRITVSNCIFRDNSANAGGGVYNIDGTSSVKNTLFIGNSAAIAAGALRNKRVISTIANCTFFDNQAPAGGAIHNVLCTGTTITNCILWSNSGSEMEGDAEVTYCDVRGGWPGLGNIDADPCFADPCAGDFHLLVDSPCIDSGDPDYTPVAGETDIDTEPRIFNGRVDMGADEYFVIYVSAYSPNDPGTGTPQDPYRRIQDAVAAGGNGVEIHVAQGLYNESIIIRNDVDLYGGYDRNDWSAIRDPNANQTTIIAQSDVDIRESAVSIIDASATVDGLTIQGSWGAIYCASSKSTGFSVRIANNVIQGNYLDNCDSAHPVWGGAFTLTVTLSPLLSATT